MVNQSKVNALRFWARWRASGAVGDIYETERRKSIRNFRNQQSSLGNLNKVEIAELVQYVYREDSESVDGQVRKYYLQLKSDRPDLAEQMLIDTQPILKDGIHSVKDIEKLCYTLYKYWSGFLIIHNGKSYTVTSNSFSEQE